PAASGRRTSRTSSPTPPDVRLPGPQSRAFSAVSGRDPGRAAGLGGRRASTTGGGPTAGLVTQPVVAWPQATAIWPAGTGVLGPVDDRPRGLRGTEVDWGHVRRRDIPGQGRVGGDV